MTFASELARTQEMASLTELYDVDFVPFEKQMTQLWKRFQERWQERDERFDLTSSVIRGDWSTLSEDDVTEEVRSPNLIQTGMKDTAEAAGVKPTVRIDSATEGKRAKQKSDKMEQIAASYLSASRWPILDLRSNMHYISFGMYAWVAVNDPVKGPRIELRDPRTIYPEPEFDGTGDVVHQCFIARDVYITQLPVRYQMALQDRCDDHNLDLGAMSDKQITFLEYYDDQGHCVIGASLNSGRLTGQSNWYTGMGAGTAEVSVILDCIPTGVDFCPVFIGQAPDGDPEPRGQFDQVIPVQKAHNRLMNAALDYADQHIYSDVWVRDLIGEMPMGGGSFINLGPQGQIGRLQPATSSMNLYQDLQMLVDFIHLGGRWPKTRPGDISQAIASGKFVESTIGMMNTVIRTIHQVKELTLAEAIRALLIMDSKTPTSRMVHGVLNNKQFLIERKQEDIDLSARVRVVFGLGFGRDPSQSAVLGLQFAQTDLISKATLRENLEGIDDPALEEIRLDVQVFQDFVKMDLMQRLQQKSLGGRPLLEMIRKRLEGKDLTEIYETYVVKPEEDAAAQALNTGLPGGSALAPGMAPDQAGMAPPAPAGADVLGMMGAGGGAPPEGGPEMGMIGRLSTPLPGGGFAGTEISA